MDGASQREETSERSMFAVPKAAPFTGVPAPAGAKEIADAARPKTSAAELARTAWRGVLPSRVNPKRWLRRGVATEVDRGVAFILSPVFMALGAFAYFGMPSEPGLLSLTAGAMVLAVAVALLRARPLAHFAATALLLAVCGAGLAKLETLRAGTKMLGGEISTQLTGRVATIETMASGRIRLTLDVVSTARPELRYAPERVRVSARAIPSEVAPGSTVVGLVRLMPPSGPVRPGSYDFSFESYFDGIGASGFFLRGPELVASAAAPSAGSAFRAAVERTRDAIAQRIRDRIGGPEGEIAAALVVGVRAGIPEDINEARRRAGIYHIISISGLHMALVAGTIMGLLRAGFALFPDFASRRPVKKYAAALAIVGLAAYLFISGGEVAAQRSFIMLAVMLVAVLFDRAALTMRNLALSALVVIALSPHEVMGPSFQMSFAATAALVGAYAAWSDHRASRPSRRPAERSLAGRAVHAGFAALAGLAATSLVAGGATAIYSAYHFQQMPSLGLFTNLAAMPIVSILVMPFAVLGLLAMPFGLDGPFFEVMGIGLAATIAIASWFAERSPVDIVGLISPVSVAVFTLALVIATVCTTRLRLAALPLALAALMLLPGGPPPDILVSEDGRLAGVSLGEGDIAVTRQRPNEFTIENWQRAMRAATMVKPRSLKASEDTPAAPPADTPSNRGDLANDRPESGLVNASDLALLPAPQAADDKDSVDLSDHSMAAVLPPKGVTRPPSPSHRGNAPAPPAEGTGSPLKSDHVAPPVPQTDHGAALISPSNHETPPAPPADTGAAPSPPQPAAETLDLPALVAAAEGAPGFACSAGLCLAKHPSGVLVAHAADALSAAPACRVAGIVIFDDAHAANPCRGRRVLVVTKRDLARHGAAAIFLDKKLAVTSRRADAGRTGATPPPVKARVDDAITEPYRPWHDHRRFSREARGMPAYVRKPKPPETPSQGAAPSEGVAKSQSAVSPESATPPNVQEKPAP